MLEIHSTSNKKYFYRVSFECLGRQLELGITYAEIDRIKENGRMLMASRPNIKGYFEQLQTKFRSSVSRSKAKAESPAT